MRLALDALGGDHGPRETVVGAYNYLKDNSGDTVLLVGDQDLIKEELSKIPAIYHSRLPISHAPENILMSESPMEAIKKKKNSSMMVGLQAHKDGEADGFVSAGSTGAQMAASLFILGRIPGVKRPAIGTFLPSQNGDVFLIDAGANADCKPMHLLQFAIMGNIFVSDVFARKSVKVGLLSIGEEPSKGNEMTIAAHQLLKEHLPNFYGNVEGGDILNCTTDVVVCDGFVGNIALKMVESVMTVITGSLKEHTSGNVSRRIGALLMKPAFKAMNAGFNYEEYGGVPLLGVDGISIICHGKSSALAIKNALKVAKNMKEKEVNLHIKNQLKAESGLDAETS